mmetsp:Transcript_21395/g.59517  ORF Transcript_21395/g.59517 Transcript_21395/m.59517 type:complete len:337 (-) Transcript_21395:683-1693(-)
MMRSMSSMKINERGLLYESMNERWMIWHFDDSEWPIISSAEIIRTNGKPESTATLAASAVLPDEDSPWSRTLMSGVRSLMRTCSTKRVRVAIMFEKFCPNGTMPFLYSALSSVDLAPNLGSTSCSARWKSAYCKISCLGSGALPRSLTSMQRVSAYDDAALTRPSISAPEKFLVFSATWGSFSKASGVMRFAFLMFLVWMLRICRRPFLSGSPISTWTSRRPGRRRASSIMSLRFVIPMRRMLLRESTPSILESSWLTTESETPVPSRTLPRCLQMASISSMMTMWSMLLSPASICSFSASAKSSRIFSSDAPTNLLRISGPLTIFGSLALSAFPI